MNEIDQQVNPRGSLWSWVRRHHLALLLVGVALKQALIISIVPVWHVPDETAHVQYSQTIVEEHRFPVFGLPKAEYSKEILDSFLAEASRDARYSGYKRFTDYVPAAGLDDRRSAAADKPARNPAGIYGPLYYLYESLPYVIFRSASIETRVFAMRVATSLLLLVMVWLAYRTAKLIRPRTDWALLVAAAIGFQPMLGYMFAGVNADNGLALASMAAIFIAVRYLREMTPKDLAWFAIMAGLAAMTKQPGWILVPMILPLWWLGRKRWPRGLWYRYGFTALSVAVLLGASWSIRGAIVNTMNVFSPEITVIIANRDWFTTAFLIKMDIFFRTSFAFSSYWGYFGWIAERTIYPSWIYNILGASSLAVLIGVGRKLLSKQEKTDDLQLERKVVYGSIFLFLMLEAGYQYLWWQRAIQNHALHFPAHGRYYLFMIFPFTVLMMFGLEQFVLPRHRRWVWGAVALVTVLIGVYAIWPTLWNSSLVAATR